MRLLLISNTYATGGGYLKHTKDEIRDFLTGIDSVLFLPYALANRDEYTTVATEYFKKLGIRVNSIHYAKNPQKAINEAKAIYAGGGNTFRLLNELYKIDVVDLLGKRIRAGVPFIGSSAGVNIAAPTVRTTNDMPIVEPPSLDALELITFQINPHYFDANLRSKHMGETREERIKEFHEENDLAVVGLREGAWLRIENSTIRLGGKNGARVFQKGKPPKEYRTGARLKLD